MGFWSSFSNLLPVVGAGIGFAIGGPAGAALGGALGSIGSIASGNAATKEQTNENMRYIDVNNQNQLNLLHEQQAFSQQQVREQNEYNTPANQLARLREAGINPAFAQGVTQAGNQSSVGNLPSTPQLQSPLDAKSLAQQNNLISSQSALNAAEAQKAFQESQNIAHDTVNISNTHELFKAIQDGQVRTQEATINLMVEQKNATKKQIQLIGSQINEISSNIDLIQQHIDQSKEEIELIKQQAKSWMYDAANKAIDHLYRSDYWFDTLKLLEEQANCTAFQAKAYLGGYLASIAQAGNLNIDTEILRLSKHSLVDLNQWSSKSLKLDVGTKAIQFKMFKSYGEAETWLRMINTGTMAFDNLSSGIGQFMKYSIPHNTNRTNNYFNPSFYY